MRPPDSRTEWREQDRRHTDSLKLKQALSYEMESKTLINSFLMNISNDFNRICPNPNLVANSYVVYIDNKDQRQGQSRILLRRLSDYSCADPIHT